MKAVMDVGSDAEVSELPCVSANVRGTFGSVDEDSDGLLDIVMPRLWTPVVNNLLNV